MRIVAPPRLIYAHDGTLPYDRLFLERLSSEFETYLVTFTTPTQVPRGIPVIQIPDFGKPLGIRKLNELRIVLGTFWRILQFRRCVRSVKPDVVIGNWVTTYGLYASMCRWVPFVLFAYGRDITLDPGRSIVHRWITARVVKAADLVLIDCEFQRRALISLGCSPMNVVSFPWVNLKDLRGIVPDPSLRHKLGWDVSTIVVSVRNHETCYDVDTLIRAIPTLARRSSSLRFMIFGSGTRGETARLVRLAHELKIEKLVFFAGRVPREKLLRYVKDCDIYVSTSLTDGTSASLIEAMYLGIPVAVTSIEANREWISDGVNGLLFDPRSPDGLASAILRLEAYPDDPARMSQAAREEVLKRVDWSLGSGALSKRILDMISGKH